MLSRLCIRRHSWHWHTWPARRWRCIVCSRLFEHRCAVPRASSKRCRSPNGNCWSPKGNRSRAVLWHALGSSSLATSSGNYHTKRLSLLLFKVPLLPHSHTPSCWVAACSTDLAAMYERTKSRFRLSWLLPAPASIVVVKSARRLFPRSQSAWNSRPNICFTIEWPSRCIPPLWPRLSRTPRRSLFCCALMCEFICILHKEAFHIYINIAC